MALQVPVVVDRVTGFDIGGGLVAADVLGDTFVNTGKEYYIVKNGSGAGITVAPHIQPTLDGQVAPDKAIAVAAGATRIIGPFPVGIYNDANSLCKITCSSITTVTMKIVSCPPA